MEHHDTIDNLNELNKVTEIKERINEWTETLLQSNITKTQPGSISWILHGEQPSEQSINIKFGRCGEFMAKEMVKMNAALELLPCGIQQINGRNKDVDLIFKNNETNTIHYFELKGNILLDTEKLPATIEKCEAIECHLREKYPDHIIECGILNWSIYNRRILTSGLANIKAFEKKIKVIHIEEFLKLVDMSWDEADYYSYFRIIGNKVRPHGINNF